MHNETDGNRSFTQSLQYALLLLEGALLQSSLLRARTGARSLYGDPFLLDAANQFFAALLLHLAYSGALQDRRLGGGRCRPAARSPPHPPPPFSALHPFRSG